MALVPRWLAVQTRYAAVVGVVLAATAVTLLTLAPVQRLGYDAYWNVFIARQDVWRNLWIETFDNEHPPVFYLLLRAAVSWFGANATAYRLVSIVATVASAWLLAEIVWRTTSNRPLAVAAAAAYGLASKVIAMGLEVRGYALCTALTLTACVFYLDWLRTPPHRLPGRTYAGFAVSLAGAILTQYCAFFFLAAAISAPAALAIIDPGWRRRVLVRLRARRIATALMFGVPLATAAAVYGLHVIYWIGRFTHVYQFMFDRALDTPAAFLARNTVNVAVLMLTPWTGPQIGLQVAFPRGAAFDWRAWTTLASVGTFCVAGFVAVFRGAHRGRPLLVVFAMMIALNAAAGLARWYPFGGELRHEFFLMPFAVASVFCLLEMGRRRWKPRFRKQKVWISAVALGVIVNVASWAAVFRVVPGRPFQSHMDRFTALVGSPEAVLVDQFNFINVFTHYDVWDWRVIPKSDEPSWQIWLVTRGSRSVKVCRDRSGWQLNLSTPDTYRKAARCLTETASQRVAIFRPQFPGTTAEWDISKTASIVHRLSEQADLAPTVVDVNGDDVYAQFAWRRRQLTHEPAEHAEPVRARARLPSSVPPRSR